jgi:superfamily II DNA or RNA helicase
MANFLTDSVMSGKNWRDLELATMRVLSHCGWHDVQDVGQSGDKGADILAVRDRHDGYAETFLFQVKAITGADYVGVKAIDQAVQGQAHYGAKIVVVVTNGDFTHSAYKRRDELKVAGFDVRLWNGVALKKLLEKWPLYASNHKELRTYQAKIADQIVRNYLAGEKKSFFVVATGLGKTVIASSCVDKLMVLGLRKVLVLCHSVDLAQQLQREFWAQIPSSIPTRLFMGGEPPVPIEGINFGLYQTLFGYLGGIPADAFDLIIVDEAHHALANAFASCIEHLRPQHLIGMTATPWRGDGASVESIFGPSLERMSLIDGMKLGYLARVDYRLMCDNIDWAVVPKLAEKRLTIKDLNKRLFLPQRDEAVIEALLRAMQEIPTPRIAVFSPAKIHAEEFARKLRASGVSCASASVDDKVTRRRLIMDFAAGRLSALTSVDVLNEGIDVPNVNILVFLRATHSRRIFVQQLGRGLRLAPGKEKLIVLDFVTDIRRMAAVTELDREAKREPKPGEIETIYLRNGIVQFSNPETRLLIDSWLEDVAGLEDEDEAQRLIFPEEMGPYNGK